MKRIWTSFGYDEINWTYTPSRQAPPADIGEFAEQPYFVRPHYVFNSGIGWSAPPLGRRQRLPRGRSTASPTTTSPSSTRPTTPSSAPATGRWSSWRSRPARSCPTTPSRLRLRASPTQWSPYEAGLWSFPPKDYPKWGGLVRALVEHCVERYGADHVRSWLWELGTSPTSPTGAAPPEQFCDLYDVTAAAVKGALPGAQVGGPTTTGDLGPAGAARLPPRLPGPLRPAAARRWTSSPSTPKARVHPLARLRPDRRPGPEKQ